MNSLKRILIILLAAALVVGATYAATQWGGLDSTTEERGGEGFGPPDRANFDGGEAMPTRPGGGDRDEAGLGGMVEVVKNVIIFAVLFVVVMVLNLLWNWLTRHWPQHRTPNAAAR